MLSVKQFYDVAGVKQHSQFQKFLENLMFQPKERSAFYCRIAELDPHSIDDDLFRGYFEEYVAERKSNQQDMTPVGMAKLVNKLTAQHETDDRGEMFADFAAGTGSLLIEKWNEKRMKFFPWEYQPHNYLFLAQERSDVTIPYLVHNLAYRGMNAVVIHGDTLECTANQIYFIQNAKDEPLGCSSVNVMPHSEEIARFFNIKQWLQPAIDHVEDELTDIVWRF